MNDLANLGLALLLFAFMCIILSAWEFHQEQKRVSGVQKRARFAFRFVKKLCPILLIAFLGLAFLIAGALT